MQLKDPAIFSAIEAIGDHYRTNISNRFTRRAISSMTLDAGTWNLIEEMTEKMENYRYQGYHLDELYSQILAMARFVFHARRDILPNLRILTSATRAEKVSTADTVLREMAIDNFGPNLKILADKINELYVKVVSIDKDNAGPKGPVFSQIPELKEIGRFLVQ
jgi:hypothetical protein